MIMRSMIGTEVLCPLYDCYNHKNNSKRLGGSSWRQKQLSSYQLVSLCILYHKLIILHHKVTPVNYQFFSLETSMSLSINYKIGVIIGNQPLAVNCFRKCSILDVRCVSANASPIKLIKSLGTEIYWLYQMFLVTQ